jgi:hypothetical protein
MRKFICDDSEREAARWVLRVHTRCHSSKIRPTPPEVPQPLPEDEFAQIVADLRRYDNERF